MKTALLFVLIVAFGVLLGGVRSAQYFDYCYAQDYNPYLFFATKTAYEFVFDKKPQSNALGCQPVQVWMLARHGTNYRKDMSSLADLLPIREQIIHNHEQRRNGKLCDQDLANLRQWSVPVKPDDGSLLTAQGRNDHLFLARRLRSRFPEALDATYTQQRFILRYADTERSKESAEAFAEGLFGRDPSLDIIPDYLLTSQNNCSRWEEQIGDNPDTKQEAKLFEKSPMVQRLVATVSRRLGFLYNVTYDTVESMYDMCRTDKAWNYTTLSPWCSVFNKQELQVLEYMEDLKYYYEVGYGNALNTRLGCPLLKDMFQRFRELSEADMFEGHASGVFYFAHKRSVMTLLTALGIAKDGMALTHQNYNSMAKRQWRTSLVAPYTGNLAAVFYRCNSGERNRVMFHLNEHVVPYDGCDVGLCSWSYIEQRFRQIVKDGGCSYGFCRGENNAQTASTACSLAATALAILVYVGGTY